MDEYLTPAAAAFQKRRTTPPMTNAERAALQCYVTGTPEGDHELGLRMIDHDLETLRMLEDRRTTGPLPPKKLITRQREIMAARWKARPHG